MTKEEIVGLGIKIASLLIIFFVFRDLSSQIVLANMGDELNDNWLAFIVSVAVCFILAAILMYRFPLTIAKSLLPKKLPETKNENLSAEEIQISAFTVLGIFILVLSIPELFYWAIIIFNDFSMVPKSNINKIQSTVSIITTIIQISLGVWLVLGAQGIQNLIKRLRQ